MARSRLTIVQLAPWLNYGGVETHIIKLAKELQRRGHRLLVVSSGGTMVPQLEAAGIRHVHMHLTGVHLPAAVHRLRALIRHEGVDLIHAHNWTAGAVGYLAAKLTGVMYALTVHGVRARWLKPLVFYWSHRVMAVSKESRDHLIKHFGLAPERVVEGVIGIETDRFRPKLDTQQLIAELGLDQAALKVLHISRFSHSKAAVALKLIEAAPLLQAQLPGIEILLVGDGPLLAQVEQAAAEMNRRLGRRAIVLCGARADTPELINLADLVVGTATVALEAMSCGKPVIAAGKGGFVGTVEEDSFERAAACCFGDHSLSKPITAEDLAEAVLSLLTDRVRSQHLGAMGRRLVLERFDVRTMTDQIEGFYRELLRGRADRQRIVVFHLNQIGDLLFSLPALRTLRELYPHAHLASVLRPYLADLLLPTGLVDELIYRREDSLWQGGQLLRELRSKRFDLALGLSQSPASTLYAYLAGIPERIGFVDAGLPWLLTRQVQRRGVPSAQKIMHLMACLGAADSEPDYQGLLVVTEQDRQAIAKLLAQSGVQIGERLVALGHGASGRKQHKSWAPEKFAQVASILSRQYGLRSVMVGAAEDFCQAEQVVALARQYDQVGSDSTPPINLCGKTTTGQLAVLLKLSELFIGVDSGPMHVAAAVGTTVVALFGPTLPEHTAPHGDQHIVITQRLPCSPCELPQCRERPCMALIQPEEVLQAVERLGFAHRVAMA